MIIYLTRHGQPALEDMPKGADYEIPDGDYVLTPQGRQQATCLGNFLKKKNFHGKIFSSPYARTMETASIVASICGVKIYPTPPIQEIRRDTPEPPCPGMTLEELQKNYPAVAPEATLAYPWMIQIPGESREDIHRRVHPFLEEIIANPPADEVLLVGHGASIGATRYFMQQRSQYEGPQGYNWNCSLCTFESFTDGRIITHELHNIEFMPLEIVTSNKRLYGDPECV